MNSISYTLLADGRSDYALINVINWSIRNIDKYIAVNGKPADFSKFRNPPKLKDLHRRVEFAAENFPSQLLFVHRDAEVRNGLSVRVSEIEGHMTKSKYADPYVMIIPVQMTEAWLLISEEAIKRAAGNNNYGELKLPSTSRLESINDPKKILHGLLLEASGRKGRAKTKFNVHQAVHLVAEYTEDFAPLFELESFNCFYSQLERTIDEILTKTT